MNKTELVARIAQEINLTKSQVNETLNAFMEAVEAALSRGERVTLVDFGTFQVLHRAPKIGRNIQTGEQIPIASRKVPKFRPGKGLEEAVNAENGS